MCPAGGYTPDMMNYAHSTDVFAAAMGNQMYILLCDTLEEIAEAEEFINGAGSAK